MQQKQREEEKSIKHQHEQLITLEERCRRMGALVKEKKRDKRKENEMRQITEEEIEELEKQLKDVETEKVQEEK